MPAPLKDHLLPEDVECVAAAANAAETERLRLVHAAKHGGTKRYSAAELLAQAEQIRRGQWLILWLLDRGEMPAPRTP